MRTRQGWHEINVLSFKQKAQVTACCLKYIVAHEASIHSADRPLRQDDQAAFVLQCKIDPNPKYAQSLHLFACLRESMSFDYSKILPVDRIAQRQDLAMW